MWFSVRQLVDPDIGMKWRDIHIYLRMEMSYFLFPTGVFDVMKRNFD